MAPPACAGATPRLAASRRRLAATALALGLLGASATGCVGEPGRNDKEFEQQQKREAAERERLRKERVDKLYVSTTTVTTTVATTVTTTERR